MRASLPPPRARQARPGPPAGSARQRPEGHHLKQAPSQAGTTPSGHHPRPPRTWGAPTSHSTLNSRRRRSTMISRCSSPMPSITVWLVSSSRLRGRGRSAARQRAGWPQHSIAGAPGPALRPTAARRIGGRKQPLGFQTGSWTVHRQEGLGRSRARQGWPQPAAPEVERRVLLSQLDQAGGHLVQVALGLGLNGNLQRTRGQPGECSAVGTVRAKRRLSTGRRCHATHHATQLQATQPSCRRRRRHVDKDSVRPSRLHPPPP